MQQKHLQFSLAYAIIFIAQVLMALDPRTTTLVLGDFQYGIKPLITISLLIYITYHTQLKGRFSKRIFSGLIFGLIGDSFLMFVKVHDNFFVAGLFAFLLGHLAYISAFYIDYKWQTAINKKATLITAITLVIYCLGFYVACKPVLGPLKYHVIVYTIVIALMVLMAVNRKGRVKAISYDLIFYGAVLFLISDTILAYDKFVHPIRLSGVFIMATYTVAQFLITLGAIERKLKKHSIIEIEADL
jgi:uncharacterized membrane protein YhhN